MRKKLTSIILCITLAICLVFLGLIIYFMVPKECKHHFCNKTKYEPSCDEKGYTLYECKSCDYTFEADFVAPLNHNYIEETIAPTCENEGYTLHSCSLCQKVIKDSVVSALGHKYKQNVIAPTCELQGCTVNSCENCDFVTRTDYTTPLGHDKEQSIVAPTCETEGYTVSTCKRCDYEYKNNYINPTGHSISKKSTTSPTCTSQGYSTYSCSKCDHEYVSDYTSPQGHSISKIATVLPTCTAQGYTKYACANCDHNYITDYTSPQGHSISKITTVVPSCVLGGYSKYECENCEHEYISDYVAPTGHTISSKVTLPTCTSEGYTTYSCSACDYQYKANVVSPEQHTYKKTYIRPNIEQTGYTIYECIVCGSKHEADFVFYSDIFSGSAGTGEGSLAFGVDISHHSYDVDFEALRKAGVDFVILRVGYNKTLDTKFEEYYQAAREAGLDIGVYFFTLAKNKEEAKADADRVAAWLEGKTFEYPIFYDVEDDPYYSGHAPSTFSETQIMEIAHTFMTTMVDHGYYPGLYTNNNFLYNVFNNEKTLRLYDVWYARYTTPTDALVLEYSKNYSMWQYDGDVSGYSNGAISGMCDVNYAFKDYPTWIKQHGFNGYD